MVNFESHILPPSQSSNLGVHFGLCPCYNIHQKSKDHLLVGCHDLRRRWATIAMIQVGKSLTLVFCKNFLWGMIHVGVMQARHNSISLIVIVEMIQSI